MSDEEKVHKLIDLQDDIARLEAKLAEARAKAAQLSMDVEAMIQAAADRHLVDEQGNPVDGAVYWYRSQALVRMGTIVRVVPVKTMDGAQVFTEPSIELPIEEIVEAF